MRFLFFYLMEGDGPLVRDVAPDHAAYWQELELEGYEGGPFADRTGGLILFDASSQTEAEELVAEDPFVTRGAVADSWIKAWSPEVPPRDTVVRMVGRR